MLSCCPVRCRALVPWLAHDVSTGARTMVSSPILRGGTLHCAPCFRSAWFRCRLGPNRSTLLRRARQGRKARSRPIVRARFGLEDVQWPIVLVRLAGALRHRVDSDRAGYGRRRAPRWNAHADYDLKQIKINSIIQRSAHGKSVLDPIFSPSTNSICNLLFAHQAPFCRTPR